jgi:hypothetical protein
MTKTASTKPATKAARKKSGTVSGPHRILYTCRTLEMSGDVNVLRKTVLTLSGVKASTFPVTISGLKKKGYIDYDKECIRLTDLGRTEASKVGVPSSQTMMGFGGNSNSNATTNEKVQETLKRTHKLTGGQRGMLFNLLLDGRLHDRTATAETIGCTNKASFAVMLSNMKKIGIIQYDKNTISLSDMCFPMGRPGQD